MTATAHSPSLSSSNTPSSSVTTPSTPCTSNHGDQTKHIPPTPTPQQSKDSSNPKNSKLGLIEQAVKIMTKVWRPDDIPTVYQEANVELTLLQTIAARHSANNVNKNLPRNAHIPPSLAQYAKPSLTAPLDPETLRASKLKGFVTEVLRNSKTSSHVVQIALCYLLAIEPKIPELVRRYKAGEGCTPETTIESRITVGTAADFEMDAEEPLSLDSIIDTEACTSEEIETVKVTDTLDIEPIPSPPLNNSEKKRRQPPPPSEPLPPMPSPLLCPRRAFVSALVLASKFMQDKCYSNRAWPKVVPWSAREVGLGERALGEALEWRLWVGKASSPAPQPMTTPAPPLPVSRTISRCRSESDLQQTPKAVAVALPPDVPAGALSSSGLRRCSTLPACAYGAVEEQPFGFMTHPFEQDLAPLPLPPLVDPDLPLMAEQPSYAYPPTERIDEHPSTSFPSLPTPELSSSPSSTDSSSSGDRTVQMSAFLDDNMASNPAVYTGSESVIWGEASSFKVSPESTYDSVSPVFAMNAGKIQGGVFGMRAYPQTAVCRADVYEHSIRGGFGMRGYGYLSEWEGQVGTAVY